MIAFGVPVLLTIAAVMMIVTLSILTFRMLMSISLQFEDDPHFNSSTAGIVGAVLYNSRSSFAHASSCTAEKPLPALPQVLNTLWITVMGLVYKDVARRINDFENHRTETEYENALIVKTFVFEFFNSYSTLFYIAFVKANGASLFNAFGYTDADGEAYHDTCGQRGTDAWTELGGGRQVFVRGDCMDELFMQLLSFIVFRPVYEIPLQLLLPRLVRIVNLVRRTRSVNKSVARRPGRAAEPDKSELAAFGEKLEQELAMTPFKGIYSEFLPKVVQYGYVAMFSAAFPLAGLAAAAANFVELRCDAHKLSFEVRRPRNRRGQGIGTWAHVLSALSWIALLVNTLVIAYTSPVLKDHVIIPLISQGKECGPGPPYAVSDLCADAVKACYAQIGGVEWLPASAYLDARASVTEPYTAEGLCGDPSNPLYDAEMCEACKYQISRVETVTAWFVIVVEHMLIVIKVLLMYLIPDTPRWIQDAEARRDFALEHREEMKAQTEHLLSSQRSNKSGNNGPDESPADYEPTGPAPPLSERRSLDAALGESWCASGKSSSADEAEPEERRV